VCEPSRFWKYVSLAEDLDATLEEVAASKPFIHGPDVPVLRACNGRLHGFSDPARYGSRTSGGMSLAGRRSLVQVMGAAGLRGRSRAA
jgi:hypothetical protein